MIYCKHCYYDLRETSAGRCPECGQAFDPDDPESFTCERSREMLRYRLLMLAPVLLAASATMSFVFGCVSPYTSSLFKEVACSALFGGLVGCCLTAAARRWERRFRGLFEALLWLSVILWILPIFFHAFLPARR